jgi:hypothetical protein
MRVNRQIIPSTGFLVIATLLGSRSAWAIPSFARQTKLPCNACHTQFPELNAFGREFKLNGYVLKNIEGIELKNASGKKDLDLPIIPMLSMMFQTSFTQTVRSQTGLPGTQGEVQNGTVQFPQQVSLFYGGEFTDHIGGFTQFTYTPAAGTFGIDNTDIRFADHTVWMEKRLVYGVSLNNNPTVQDIWNSTPAWRFPYASSGVAPTPAATPLIDNLLAQKVMGVTAYAMWDDLIYAEAGVYRSAPQGIGNNSPLNGNNASNVISNVAPYWRFGLQKQVENQYFMIGTFGLAASLLPGQGAPGGALSLSGSSNTFTDVGIDANYQVILDDNSITAHASWIRETQKYSPTFIELGGAENGSDVLNSFQLATTFHWGSHWSFTAAPFWTFGSRDQGLYAPAPITGSRTGRPDSEGITLEIDLNAWRNARLALQYVTYFEFNGAHSNYDGFGRNASANNTLYLLGWLAY